MQNVRRLWQHRISLLWYFAMPSSLPTVTLKLNHIVLFDCCFIHYLAAYAFAIRLFSRNVLNKTVTIVYLYCPCAVTVRYADECDRRRRSVVVHRLKQKKPQNKHEKVIDLTYMTSVMSDPVRHRGDRLHSLTLFTHPSSPELRR